MTAQDMTTTDRPSPIARTSAWLLPVANAQTASGHRNSFVAIASPRAVARGQVVAR